MPNVSVVVPVFNAQRFLAETLACLQKQTLSSIEVLCVDDGSTDSSADIVRDFAEQDSRFQLLTKSNGGVGSARNLGLSRATGEYVCFIDADDLTSPDYLTELYDSTLPEKPDIMVTGNVVELWPDGSTNPRRVGVFGEALLYSAKEKSPLVTTTGLTQNKLYKMTFLNAEKLGHYLGKSVSEDNYFTICSIALAGTVKTILKGTYRYRQHHSSITKTRKSPDDVSMFDVYDQARAFLARSENAKTTVEVWEPIIQERQRIDLTNFHNELNPPDRAKFRAMTEQLTHGRIRIARPSNESRRIFKYHAKQILSRLGLYRAS